VAFQLGRLTVTWYGILVAVGFLAGLWTASRRAPRAGIAPETVMDLGPWLIVGAILGARAFYVISYWEESFANAPWTEIFMIHHGGLVFYGGFIGASLAYIVFVRWRRCPFWSLADVIAPSIALGHAIGRLGCLMNGCCYGKACDLPWAIRFPGIPETGGTGVHPTQLYEAALNLGLYAALAWLFRRRPFDGVVLAAYLVAYAVLRSFVELFRGDYASSQIVGGLTPAHWISVALFAAGLLLFWKLPRRASRQA
jgi:phosphatidylglycerol:prolipoprotein diacylglycerol transferase